MLPTFVIGLREGLEASLIVGIVAAFLKRNARRDLMRWVLLGVAAAAALCAAGGIGLYVVSADLPQREQEGLETVIGAIAVAMVTYMVVWMKRHSRDLKKQLEGVAGSALASGSAWALVAMAFLAVLREGFETAVFLVAAFNGATSRGAAGGGALLGVALAVALGYGIYRGGVRINLSRFFRVTGFVLVLVAAGLVQTAFRTAHEAGWLDWGQQATVDLTAVVAPGSVQSALITGMLGIQPQPTLIEFVAWLLYLVPLGVYVAWPPGRGLARRVVAAWVAAAAVVTGLVAGALVLTTPSAPAAALRLTGPVTPAAGGTSSAPVTVALDGATLTASAVDPVTGQVGPAAVLPATPGGRGTVDGVGVDRWSATFPATTTTSTLTFDEVAALNGGRLPLGVRAPGDRSAGAVAATTTGRTTVTVAVSAGARHLVAATWTSAATTVVDGASGPTTVTPASPPTAALAPSTENRALAAARTAESAMAARRDDRAAAGLLGVVAALIAVVALGLGASDLRRRRSRAPAPEPALAELPASSPVTS